MYPFSRAQLRTLAKPGQAPFDPRRWFTADDELISFGGDTYAFSTQWGKFAEDKMRDLVETHGGGKASFERL